MKPVEPLADRSISPGWIKRIQELIQNDPTVTPSLEQLSQLVGLHPVYIARSFRTFTGMTIGEFSRSRRLQLAQRLLKNPSLSLAQVAQLAGFVDQSHLTRLFRRPRSKMMPAGLPLAEYEDEFELGHIGAISDLHDINIPPSTLIVCPVM